MKDTFYFKHDNNAQHDPKMIKLRMKYGWEGYGLFWAFLEVMAETELGYIQEEDLPAISFGLNYTEKEMEEFIAFCLGIKLLKKGKLGIFAKRMIEQKEFRKVLSDSGKRGAKGTWGNGVAIGQAKGVASGQADGRKGKERKGKERKGSRKGEDKTSSSPFGESEERSFEDVFKKQLQ